LSASDLLFVLHRFYANKEQEKRKEQKEKDTQELAAPIERSKQDASLKPETAFGTITISEPGGS